MKQVKRKVPARDQAGMISVKGEAVIQAHELEARALCEDRKFRIIRPLQPQPPVWIKLPEQITQSADRPYLFTIPPHHSRREEKPEEVVAPFGGIEKLIRVQEPFFKNMPQGSVGGHHFVFRNYDGTSHERLNTETKEWTLEQGDFPIDLKAKGFARYPAYLMPKDHARFFLRLDEIKIVRLHDLTDDEIRLNGCWLAESGNRLTQMRSQWKSFWVVTYGDGYHTAGTQQPALPWDSNPFVWVATVWPSHLLPQKVLLPPVGQERPRLPPPGTWSPKRKW